MASSPFTLIVVCRLSWPSTALPVYYPNHIILVSPYSWFGFTNTVRFRPLLEAYGVSVEIFPFFLGGARDSVGNPFTPPLKAKEAFGNQDSHMTGELLGLKVVPPKVFPISSLFVSSPAACLQSCRLGLGGS